VAQMDLQIAGSWAKDVGTSNGFTSPEVTGTVRLHNVRTTVRGVNGPIEISEAELKLLPDETRVEKLNAQAADAHWTGSIALPRGCGAPGACMVHFNLNTEEVGLEKLHEWLSAQPRERRWYQVLSATEPAAPTFLQSLRASGKVSAGRLRIHNLLANKVSASLELERGKLKVSGWRADVLGGKHQGDWQVDFAEENPVYAGSGSFSAISLGQIADTMHDPWIAGTATGTYQIEASGADSAAFWQTAEGELQFDMRDGLLPHIALSSDEGPLHVIRWQGDARLRHGKIEIPYGKLISPAGAFEISGSASLGRLLDLKLARDTDVKPGQAGTMIYSITGTVAEPLITRTVAPETQAQLKP
jgi:hypothetical protein